MKTKLICVFILVPFLFFHSPIFTQPILSEECQAPSIHELSDTLQINGDFDGVTDNTRLVIGGQLVYPVWETRTYARFILEKISPGEQSFELSDQRLFYQGDIRLIRIKKDLPDIRLKRREKASFSVQVEGMDGFEQPLIVQFHNKTSSDYAISGGDVQQWVIRPGEPAFKSVEFACKERKAGRLKIETELLKGISPEDESIEVVSKK